MAHRPSIKTQYLMDSPILCDRKHQVRFKRNIQNGEAYVVYKIMRMKGVFFLPKVDTFD